MAQHFQNAYDVAVVGAGPVGSAAALAFADRGERVLLLEANPKASHRFAGEWMHPPSVDLLRRLGVQRVSDDQVFSSTKGFVVFPDDGGEPIPLPYESGQSGLAGEHCELVAAVRDAATDHAGVEFAPRCRVQRIEGTRLKFADVDADAIYEVTAERIIGADGRASMARKSLGLSGSGRHMSYMGGVVLTDVELPFEGYGHVFVGPPGPVLAYRISSNAVRVTIDLPTSVAQLRKNPRQLASEVAPWLPPLLDQALRRTLQEATVVWMGTRFRPRCDYGAGPVALVGDAVGHFHPLTAAGMTMGFMDVDCLVSADSVRQYQRLREARSYVPELLSNALYELFTRSDEATVAMRRAVYRSWRESPRQRQRLMRMLTGADTSKAHFTSTVIRIGLGASMDLAASTISSPASGMILRNLRSLAGWGRWPMASALPTSHRGALRTSDWPATSSRELEV